MIGGVTLAAVVVCGYALLTKVFPSSLDAHDIYARLQAPYGYWNATGLTAAMGVIGCMWLGARRAGHALLSALAYPAMGLLLVALMLAYSRGALVALALGLALWFAVVPLRLRGAAVLLTGAVGAGLVVAWDFSKHALSTESVALHARVIAGRQLGVLLVAMLVLLAIVGVAIGFSTDRRPLSRVTRYNAGAVLLSILALAVIAFAGALAASHRGLPGSISHGFNSLTNTHAAVPANTPGRLTAIGSVRARYWNEALKVFQAHPVLGAGARSYGTARLRYRTEDLEANDAHGFVVQTLPIWAWWDWRSPSRCSSPGWPRQDAPRTPSTAAGRVRTGSPFVAIAWRQRDRRLHTRAHRHAEHALPRGRVRRPLDGGLDLVRARRRLRGTVLRGLARRPRSAAAGDCRTASFTERELPCRSPDRRPRRLRTRDSARGRLHSRASRAVRIARPS